MDTAFTHTSSTPNTHLESRSGQVAGRVGLHMGVMVALFTALLLSHSSPGAMKSIDFSELPVIDLDEYEVIYNRVDFTPEFDYQSPQFTYFDVPELPRGELIMALDFVDRYRQSTIPGQHKWAGLLTFPMFTGNDRPLIKWLCLYMYDDVMYGYDPTPKDEAASRIVTTTVLGPMTVASDPNLQMEFNRRFIVPVRYEERTDPSVLFRFAESYVEAAYPLTETDMSLMGYDDELGSFTDEFLVTTQAGRIAPVLDSQKGREDEELVRLVYQFYENPNPGRFADPTMGPQADFMNITWDFGLDFSWETIEKELGGFKVHDYIALAKRMIAPRWSQKVTFHYKQGFLFWDLSNTSSILLFNVGNKLFAYSPRYGVWKTDGHASHLSDPEVLRTKLKYPGIENVERIELIPN